MSTVRGEFIYQTNSDEQYGISRADHLMNENQSIESFPVHLMPQREGDTKESIRVKQELYDSERTYLHYLSIIQKLFINPLAHLPKIVSKTDLRTLFGEISSIYLVNKELLYSLRICLTVHEAFNFLGPFLKLYSAYARNYQASHKIYNKLMAKNEFRTFIHEQEKDFRCEGMKFYALLVMPIQRIPRYILLLQRLCEMTNSREEKFELQKVLHEMHEITDLIESCIRDYENSEKLWLIQESLGLKTDIVAPGRRLIKEGVLYKRTHCGETSYYERMFWLFNDILVYGKRRIGIGPKYECSCIYPLRHCVLDYSEMDGSLNIKCKSHSILVTSDSYAGLKSWHDELKEAVERVKLLRSTLRKESSRQQVKEYKSNVKRQITKKFINKTYLYDLSNTYTMERLKVQKKKWAKAATCSTDVNVMSSPLKADAKHGQRKRRGDTDFDQELMEAIRKRRLELEATTSSTSTIEQNTQQGSNSSISMRQEERLEEIKKQHLENPDQEMNLELEKGVLGDECQEEGVGLDMEDKVPRTRSAARSVAQSPVKRRVERQLTRPEIRKYSYQEISPSAPPASSSRDEDSGDDEHPRRNDRYERITSPPWWLQEAQPKEFAKSKEGGGLRQIFKGNCSIM